jgi:trimeric autotransporter adhesin
MVTAAVACVVAGPLAAGGPALADPAPPSAVVDSGPNWTVTQAAGGYAVTVALPGPLPVVDDVPVLVADGITLGPADESADGRTLTLNTMDPAVAAARDITWQWSTGSSSGPAASAVAPSAAAPPRSPISQPPGRQATARALASDPTSGSVPYATADYNFGAQAIPLANIAGVRGEVQGRIYLPATSGPHPLVVFMHGRHSTCYNTTTNASANIWPCPGGDAEIPSYAGYDGAGDALASNGYVVVSISANAINANDNQHAPDDGAVARGQLFLDTLTWLRMAGKGQPVSFFDAATSQAVTLDQALAGTSLTARSLVGMMNFSDIGIMGHSRGGEGAATASALNSGLAHPWGIKSVFMLAPIDFTRTAIPDVVTTTLLPYCDGDVSDQQGQHFYADSRYTSTDYVLRSDIWVMGADHDFLNFYWTPPFPGAADDWTSGRQSATDPVCGLSAPNQPRLTATQEYAVGSAYLAGFFALTLGGKQKYLPMFDGQDAEPASVASFADVRTVAQQPLYARNDLTSFAASPGMTTSGSATATNCAGQSGRTVPVPLPPCAIGLTNQQVPYWTPANFAPNVPLNQMTHLTWADGTGALTVAVPDSERDVSQDSELTVSMSPDASVPTGSGTDMTLTVTDGSGQSYSTLLSALNAWTVTRMPSSTSTLLGKIVLQQAHLPTVTLKDAGLNLRDITSVSFTAAVGADGLASGGEYLQDLAFDYQALGTTSVYNRPAVSVASTSVQEATGPTTDEVALYLSEPSDIPVTAYLTVIGSPTGKVGLAMQPVTFPAGQTCQVVQVPVTSNGNPSATPTTAFKIAVSDPANAVLGPGDFATITVAANAVTAGPTAPPEGAQGDACAELSALSHPGDLSVSPARPVTAGSTVTVSGTGYRAGESVAFTVAGQPASSVLASGSGTVSFQVTIPASQPKGKVTISAVGAGSGFTSSGKVVVTS